MDGILSHDGSLCVKRESVLREQFCPHQRYAMCGDWCPALVDDAVKDAEGKRLIELACCGVYVSVEDKREEK